jgi:hypothetical protein
LYLVGGRDVALAALARARAAGCSALVVTIDTPVAGMRERDLRNGTKELLSGNPVTMFRHVWQFFARPWWFASYLRDGGLMSFPNVMLPSGPMPYADVGAMLAQSMTSWDDLAWIREAWGGKVVVKGVHTADDARRAIDGGADAIVVSNHGGRQLDGVAATIRVLPEVVAAVGDRTEVLVELSKTGLCRVWKQPTGVGYPKRAVDVLAGALRAIAAGHGLVATAHAALESFKRIRPIHYGVEGGADISGILVDGRRLEVECKTGGGVLEPQQRVFRDMIVAHGGLHIEARSAVQAAQELRGALPEDVVAQAGYGRRHGIVLQRSPRGTILADGGNAA